MKPELHKLDAGKLETIPVDFSKLSNEVKNEVAKKTDYSKLVKKVNAIQTTDESNLFKKRI